ncbi:MAG: hypothetical protein J6B26_01100 [Agathobacter sp.]|nr:hypothetical protein [Agathobacter sp.]
MKNKKLVTTLGAVALLGAIGVGSTLAYLTDTTGTVTNTFTVGNVTFDDDNEVGSGLRESDVIRDKDGNYVDNDGDNTWTVITNDYTSLVAGETVYKDPTVVMGSDSEVAWVFAQITNTNDAAFANIAWSEDWVKVDSLSTDAAVVYAKKTTIAASESSTIFTSVTLSKDITGETVIPQIEVKAFAIQAAGFDSYTDALDQVKFN